jgi:hypothetical protein
VCPRCTRFHFSSSTALRLDVVCALGHGALAVGLRCGCGCDGWVGMFPGKAMLRVADHKHYVQGVAWDPAGEFLVSQSGDRTCRVYSAVLPQKVNGKTPTNVEWVKFLSCSVRGPCGPPPYSAATRPKLVARAVRFGQSSASRKAARRSVAVASIGLVAGVHPNAVHVYLGADRR